MSMQIEFDTYQHFYNIMLNLSCTLCISGGNIIRCINNNNVLSDTAVHTGKGDLAELAEWRKRRKHRNFCLGEQVQH